MSHGEVLPLMPEPHTPFSRGAIETAEGEESRVERVASPEESEGAGQEHGWVVPLFGREEPA